MDKEKDVANSDLAVGVEKIKSNSIATMHNKFVEARYKLTIEEQRIMLVLISLIQPDDEDFKDYKIPVKVVADLIGTKHKNMYKVLDEATSRLMQRVIKIETIDDQNKKTFKKFSFISYAEYREGRGYLLISIDKHLKPYLLKLKEKFTKVPLKYVFPLRSIYAVRLYELLKQYEGTGFRVDYLPDLREMLGIEENEYTRFDNFERRVLKTAIKEINEKTDLEVSYQKKKTGRKITHIEFKIKTKQKISNDKDEKEIIEKVRILNEGDTQTTKSPSESVDIQGQEKQTKSSIEEVWEEIGKLRKEYKKLIDEISLKVNRLNENQILFLLINVDHNLFPEKVLKEIIVTADKNRSLNNPMGFLISTLQINMKTARFKELTLTNTKIDEELFKEKLEDKFVEGKPATEMMKKYWNDRIKGKVDRFKIALLRDPLRKAVYDDIENIVYIPVPDEVYKDWFESNFLNDLKMYLKENFGIDKVCVEVLS